MGTLTLTSMKVFILAALVAVSAARPRFLVIPIEDVDFEGSMGQLPVYRMPQLARQARMAQEEQDSFQSVQGQYDQSMDPTQSRRLRKAQEEQDSFQSNPYEEQGQQYAQSRDSAQSSSNAYAAPAAHAGPDHVDYGAYTGGYGAFGWYTDHPVLLTGH